MSQHTSPFAALAMLTSLALAGCGVTTRHEAPALDDAATAPADPLAALAGRWTGDNGLFLMPTSPKDGSTITAEVEASELGRFVSIRYAWAEGTTPHEGILVIARKASGAATGAAWIDSFHTGAGLMTLEAAPGTDGGVLLQTTYPAPTGPDWGWDIAIVPESRDAWRMVMHNLPPDVDPYVAVEAHLTRVE